MKWNPLRQLQDFGQSIWLDYLDRDMIESGELAKLIESDGLRGEIAVASAKQAYALYKKIFAAERFQKLALRGARPQRVLWASTGTKNPAYLDTKYIEPLIGPETINTMPQQTLEAYRDHGRPAARLEDGLGEARQKFRELAELDIDIDSVTQQLEEEGMTLRRKAAALLEPVV